MKTDLPQAERMAKLFAGNEKAHGTHGEPDPRTDAGKYAIKKTAKTLKEPATAALWEAHIAGKRPLGVIPIREDNTCSWGSIDFDVYDVNLLDIVDRVEKATLPLVPCLSKSGGLHLFLFLGEPAPAGDVQTALRNATATLGMEGCEIFPKQTNLDAGGVGNWMVMPYFGSTYDGKLRMQHGLKKTGAEMTIGEFVNFAEGKQTTLDKFVALIAKPTRPNAAVSSSGDFSDGPPCLQHMAKEGFPADGRKRALFMMAIYFKRSDQSGWKEQLEEANRKFFPTPLPSEEVVGVIKSVGKKNYEYTCKEEPMRSVCNSGLCRTRAHGVGEGGGSAPVIVGWRKISSDNPVWFMTVEGSNGELEIRRIDDITNFRRFADQCAKQLNRFFPPVKAADWANILRDAASRMTDDPAGEDTTRAGTFRELLEDFLTNRMRGDRRVDVFGGRPFEDQEKQRHEFRMRDLHTYVVREGMRDATRHECEQWIKNLGGGRVSSTPTTIEGKGVRLWFVPSSAVQATPTIEPPPVPESEI